MLYSKKQKISIILFLFAIIILTLFLIKFQLDPIFEESTINRGVEAYFDISNANKTIFYFLALIIITPNLFTINYFKYKNNSFINLITERINLKTYTLKITVKVFLDSFLFYLLLNVAIIAMIHFTYSPIDFTKETLTFIFSPNPFLNFGLYILFSCIGFGFYNIFLIQMIYIIKNEFMFRAFSLLNFILSLISVIMFKQIFLQTGLSNELAGVISSFITPMNLLTPGLLFECYGLLSFTLSAIFYIALSIVLWKISYRSMMQNG